ncbi:RNA demethylase ALKBH9B isoform X2 [Punica granatum]|uniref:RNA demethylase ALKBH9B isoform X2 n=1 Tax=Punica granatum TaxID=22663 RepID=A0A6P8D6W8_PUNGR|nr:RNA demethylase ALKBH9B isoform X2 [Punica granatum]
MRVDGEPKPLQSEEGLNTLTSNAEEAPEFNENNDDNCDRNSLGSDQDEAETHSLGSWKDGAQGCFEPSPEVSTSSTMCESLAVGSQSPHMSWADMAQEDELEEEDEQEAGKRVVDVDASTGELRISAVPEKPKLPREQREQIRFMNVKRNKDFICFERINGKLVNILQGLELHTGVFSAAEQKRIVDYVYELQEKGKRGELKDRTYSAPHKWMRGKGRVTLQFGCCYNYATDRNGNPPGILQNEFVDPIPHLFKVIIRRLVRWHVLPPTCVPDSCIVNIYEEGDCIPPHIDNHDFVRPFCTVSFLSECNIRFGSNLKVIGAGEFEGSMAISLPVGSVLVLNGNGADVAKHCVPAVPTKRISITFRRMDESKRPKNYAPEPDLQDIQPLSYEDEKPRRFGSYRPRNSRRQSGRREANSGARGYPERNETHGDSPHHRNQPRQGSSSRPRFRGNLGN